ncbi:MAG TPA: DEAD/DEAH box helicase [Bdellovibrionota bacterium]|nr:DEAD/DEAH box helicase [Bdellovibrionota bacterium]
MRQFPRAVLIRGRGYFRSGHVSDPTQIGEAFSLTVDGNGERYSVWIDFSQAATAGAIEARCACPFYAKGVLCKHLWASIIKLERSGLSDKVPGTGTLRILHERGTPARGIPANGSAARGPVPVERPRATSSTPWLERLDQIQGKGIQGAAGIAGNRIAAFVIPAAETIATGKLILDFWPQRLGPMGEPGPLRPSRVPERDLLEFGDPRDQEMVALLSRTGSPRTVNTFGSACTRFTVDPIFEAQVLTTLAGMGKTFLSRSPNGSPDQADRPLRMDRGKPWDLELRIENVGSNYRLEGVLRRDDEPKSINEPACVLKSGLLILGERIGRLAEARHAAWLTQLRAGDFLVPQQYGDLLLQRILTDPSAPRVTWPEGMGWKRSSIEPVAKGAFRPLGNDPSTGRMSMTISFDYRGHETPLADPSESILDVENHQVYPRNRVFEEAAVTQALEILGDPTGTVSVNDLLRAATTLSEHGWIVYIENQRVLAADDFALKVDSTTDWFDVSLEATFAGHPVRREEILAALEAKTTFVRLKDGSLGLLPEDWLERFETLREFGDKTEEGSIRFDKAKGLLLNAALGDDDEIKGDKGFSGFRERIQQFGEVKTVRTPAGFKGKLRKYQKDGLTWLGFLQEFQSGGILADDMGLGKTIQVLAFLLSRKKTSKLPSLVVAPKSLVFNWIDEAAKFAPTLKVVRYAGGGRKKLTEEIGKADLVVTTYGTLRTDIEKLQSQEFDVAIIDEAQYIKNAKSQSAIACKQLRAVHRLALTGTPIENSIRDLLSILEFTNPGLLHFQNSDDLSNDLQGTLARLLRPFMLRRTKEAVLTELPEKSEQVLFCEMDPEETEYYAVIRDRYRESIEQSLRTDGLSKSKLHVLEALLRLRQASCHAGLIDETKRSQPSAKTKLLLNQLKEVIAEGHKAIVFSQFTSLLAIVRSALDAEGITYEYLDGQTGDRKTPVERFQTDKACPVFLISLKAGGTGLNLTAADYVFILDPWWNPAVEAQAIGRAHRMGQTNKVFAYRMVTRGTVEEKILELQKKKKDLAESIISEDTDFMKKLTREDLAKLLAP